MALVDWKPEFSVGIHALDSDHQLLISLINQVEDAVALTEERFATLGSIMNALQDYSEYHFAREEALMKACYYPDLGEHREQHEKLLGQLLGYRYQFANHPEEVDMDELLSFLSQAYKDHLLDADKKYEAFMVARPEIVQAANEEFVHRDNTGNDFLFIDMD